VSRQRTKDADTRRGSGAVSAIRTQIAQLVWLVCVACAVVLALGALLIALDANRDNELVDLVLRAADAVDLGVFSRQDGVKQFHGEGAQVKNALVNWGLGAVAWLVIGRVLDRIIRP
jgi:hypothetical protein